MSRDHGGAQFVVDSRSAKVLVSVTFKRKIRSNLECADLLGNTGWVGGGGGGGVW